jgi:hypothetical protein
VPQALDPARSPGPGSVDVIRGRHIGPSVPDGSAPSSRCTASTKASPRAP